MIFLGRPRGSAPGFGGFPALARDEAAFLGDVADAIIPIILPAPQVQMGQASTWARKAAMSHEPPASSMPMAVGSEPQKSLRGIVALLKVAGNSARYFAIVCPPSSGAQKSGVPRKGKTRTQSLYPVGTARGTQAREPFKSSTDKPLGTGSEDDKFCCHHNFLLCPAPCVACGVLFEYNINLSVRFVKKKVKLFLDIFNNFVSMRNCMVFVY